MKKAITFAVSLLGALFFSSQGFGCSCIPQTFESGYHHADTVVEAKVLSMARLMPPDCALVDCHKILVWPLIPTYIYRMELVKIFKGCGPVTKTFIVETPVMSINCGIQMTEGTEHVLHLMHITRMNHKNIPREFYELNICQGHRLKDSLSDSQIIFLQYESKQPQNQCHR